MLHLVIYVLAPCSILWSDDVNPLNATGENMHQFCMLTEKYDIERVNEVGVVAL